MQRIPRLPFATGILLAAVSAGVPNVHAGYEQPNFIVGCRSSNGRYEITAQQTKAGKGVHGPNAWEFTWRDTKSGETRTYPARELQGGQVYANLYIAPDGETFGLWNHVTMFWPEKSASHASGKLPKKPEPGTETDEWKNQDVFSHRINVYRSKDGELVKSLAVVDLLQPEEWQTVLPVFNRVHWCREYDRADGEKKINFKKAPRPGYAFHRISPDYTVLEFQAATSRAKRREPPRVVRVDLTTGSVIPPEKWPTAEAKVPVRPYVGDDEIPAEGKANVWKEAFVPSLDPVREAYRYDVDPSEVESTTPTSFESASEDDASAADSIDP